MHLKINQDSYTTFSVLLEFLIKNILENSDIHLHNQNNWHESHPFYRIHTYKNIQLSQVMGIYLMFNTEFLSKFDTIIEIGTYNGGLSTWLVDNKNQNTKFVTYDIDSSVTSPYLSKTIDNRLEDCFNESTFNDIIEMIQGNGKCLVLCDGGNKPKEFGEFSKYLKSGDHIMCHDYCKDNSNHQFATSFWQWPYHIDTFYKDIEEHIINNELEPYNHDAWQFFLWGSYIKI
jgi:hypothetical protein